MVGAGSVDKSREGGAAKDLEAKTCEYCKKKDHVKSNFRVNKRAEGKSFATNGKAGPFWNCKGEGNISHSSNIPKKKGGVPPGGRPCF